MKLHDLSKLTMNSGRGSRMEKGNISIYYSKKRGVYGMTINVTDSKILLQKGIKNVNLHENEYTGEYFLVFSEVGARLSSTGKDNKNLTVPQAASRYIANILLGSHSTEKSFKNIVTLSENLSKDDAIITFKVLKIS